LRGPLMAEPRKKKGRSAKPQPPARKPPLRPPGRDHTRGMDTPPLRLRGPPPLRLRVTPYEIVEDAVRPAVLGGLRRATKHTDHPTEDETAKAIADWVLVALTEVLDFEDHE